MESGFGKEGGLAHDVKEFCYMMATTLTLYCAAAVSEFYPGLYHVSREDWPFAAGRDIPI
jgi:hypothetical protein